MNNKPGGGVCGAGADVAGGSAASVNDVLTPSIHNQQFVEGHGTLYDGLWRLLQEGCETDVLLIAQNTDNSSATNAAGESLPAHRLILCSRSPVLRALLTAPTSNQQPSATQNGIMVRKDEIHISNVSVPALRTVLTYMYTDNLSALTAVDNHVGDGGQLLFLLDLLQVTRRLGVHGFTDVTRNTLLLRLASDELGQAPGDLIVSLERALPQLAPEEGSVRMAVLYRLACRLPSVLKDPQLDFVSLNTLHMILQLGVSNNNDGSQADANFKNCLREVDYYSAALRWARRRCLLRGVEPTGSHLRQILGPVLFDVRFSSMSPEDLAADVRQSGVLTAQEMVSLLSMSVLQSPPKDRSEWADPRLSAQLRRAYLQRSATMLQPTALQPPNAMPDAHHCTSLDFRFLLQDMLLVSVAVQWIFPRASCLRVLLLPQNECIFSTRRVVSQSVNMTNEQSFSSSSGTTLINDMRFHFFPVLSMLSRQQWYRLEISGQLVGNSAQSIILPSGNFNDSRDLTQSHGLEVFLPTALSHTGQQQPGWFPASLIQFLPATLLQPPVSPAAPTAVRSMTSPMPAGGRSRPASNSSSTLPSPNALAEILGGLPCSSSAPSGVASRKRLEFEAFPSLEQACTQAPPAKRLVTPVASVNGRALTPTRTWTFEELAALRRQMPASVSVSSASVNNKQQQQLLVQQQHEHNLQQQQQLYLQQCQQKLGLPCVPPDPSSIVAMQNMRPPGNFFRSTAPPNWPPQHRPQQMQQARCHSPRLTSPQPLRLPVSLDDIKRRPPSAPLSDQVKSHHSTICYQPVLSQTLQNFQMPLALNSQHQAQMPAMHQQNTHSSHMQQQQQQHLQASLAQQRKFQAHLSQQHLQQQQQQLQQQQQRLSLQPHQIQVSLAQSQQAHFHTQLAHSQQLQQQIATPLGPQATRLPFQASEQQAAYTPNMQFAMVDFQNQQLQQQLQQQAILSATHSPRPTQSQLPQSLEHLLEHATALKKEPSDHAAADQQTNLNSSSESVGEFTAPVGLCLRLAEPEPEDSEEESPSLPQSSNHHVKPPPAPAASATTTDLVKHLSKIKTEYEDPT